jgi:hypothetical protein
VSAGIVQPHLGLPDDYLPFKEKRYLSKIELIADIVKENFT